MKTYIAISLLLFPIVCYSGQTDTIKVTRNNNVIEIAQQRADTISVINPQTYKQGKRVIRHSPIPLTLNGINIFFDERNNNFILKAASTQIQECIQSVFKNIKDELPAGSYSYQLPDIVIDINGKVAYYSTNAFTASAEVLLTEKQYNTINIVFEKALNELELVPMIIDGEKTPFRLSISEYIRLAQ